MHKIEKNIRANKYSSIQRLNQAMTRMKIVKSERMRFVALYDSLSLNRAPTNGTASNETTANGATANGATANGAAGPSHVSQRTGLERLAFLAVLHAATTGQSLETVFQGVRDYVARQANESSV